MSRPDLSVVIPSHRRVDLLRPCLAAVWRHAPPNTEVIVVDDGSAGACVSATAAEFPSVRVVRLDPGRGFCAAANAGVAIARAEIVELLNDDTLVWPGWAEHGCAPLSDERVVAVAPLLLRPDGRIDSAGDDYDLGGFASGRGRGEVWRSERFPAGPVFGACAAAAFYRRSAFLAAGGFPEEFGAYFDDVDLSFRLRRAGGEIVFAPDSVVMHVGSSSYGKRPSRRTLQQMSRNEEWVYWRNVDRPWRRLPRHLAVLMGKALRRMCAGQLAPWVFGRLEAWLNK